MYKLFLDFGHGGSDTGAISNGLIEKNINLVTGLECKKVLAANGVKVATSRLDDRYVGLKERAEMANAWGADYFISIHYNSGGGDGVEVIHSIIGGKGEKLAKAVVNSINKVVGQNLRAKSTYSKSGVDGRDYYAVIRETNMDAIIIECGFIDSPDRILFDTSQKQQMMGAAIAYGILDYLGITIKETVPIPKKYFVRTGDFLAKNGLEMHNLTNRYFYDIERIYVNPKGTYLYFETQYLSKEKCNEIINRLAKDNLYASIVER